MMTIRSFVVSFILTISFFPILPSEMPWSSGAAFAQGYSFLGSGAAETGWTQDGTTTSTTNNVGIGTDSPTEPLQVDGHFRASNIGIGVAAFAGIGIMMAASSADTRISSFGFGSFIDFGYSPSTEGASSDFTISVGTAGSSRDLNLVIPSTTGSIQTFTNGTARLVVNNDGGVTIGSPTGGSQGAGTLNATGVYDDGVLLTDYVFEQEYIEDELPSIEEMTAFYEQNKHLDTIPGRREWEEEGKPSLGKLQSALYKTVEHQAIYISQLHERLEALEAKVSTINND